MEIETRRKVAGYGAVGAIVLAVVFGPGPGPTPPRPACETTDLQYKQSIKDQIEQLCAIGMLRSEAIDNLAAVYRTPGINPEQAVSIVRTAAGMAAMNADPLRYVK